ncbi:hypothetical protein ES705_05022 [subsurface metagenome]
MRITENNIILNFDTIPTDDFWNHDSRKELKLHKIHAYPAKFPAFLISKSLAYAEEQNIQINNVTDIFCGCGTTALEAKQNNIDFWGCDINPVATLIAKVKSGKFAETELKRFFNKIVRFNRTTQVRVPEGILNHERIRYWFEEDQIVDLYKLLFTIEEQVRVGKYRNFFLCAFSNILKPTSRWLTKSIKPQIDPNKPIRPVEAAFIDQFNFMFESVVEVNSIPHFDSRTRIVTQNFLNKRIQNSFADLLITSPSYFTSYEYADLHQLSTLWLGYTNDYRTLREGTIGSLHHKQIKRKEIENLNEVGYGIWSGLYRIDKAKARSAAKYLLDIHKTIDKSYSMINPGGMAVFVIGNTKYGEVKVDNAKYLTKCMLDTGFGQIDVIKRKVSSKILTPYRDKRGKFSSDKRRRKVYGDEYIVIGRKER